MSGIDEVLPICKKECYDGEWTLRDGGERGRLIGWLSSEKRAKSSNFRHHTIVKHDGDKYLDKIDTISCIRCHETHRIGDVIFMRVIARVKRDVANNRYYVHNGSRETWIDMEMSR